MTLPCWLRRGEHDWLPIFQDRVTLEAALAFRLSGRYVNRLRASRDLCIRCGRLRR